MNPKASEEIHQMTGKPRHHSHRHDGMRGSTGPNRTSSRQPRRDKSKQMKCKFCSKVHAMKKESCPAWGKSCDACKGKNHFKNSERCPKYKRNVHGVHEYGYSDTDSSSCASISTVTTTDVCTIKSSEDSPVYCNMVVNKQLVKLQVDCGATVNVLPRLLCRAFIPYLSCAGFPSENMQKLEVMQIRTAGLTSWLANLVL